ncbi:hypothetical protein BH24ACT5_BH24ACT5_04750 [soil metagenome]
MSNDDQNTYVPPATQADLDKIIGERLGKERAKYAGFDDLKAKADKLDDLEAKNKSELDKAQERAAAAERERDAARLEQLRYRIAAEFKITDVADAIAGNTEDEIKANAERLASLTQTKSSVINRSASTAAGRAKDSEPTGKERAAAAVRELYGNHT